MGQFRWDFICHGTGRGPSCLWAPRQSDSSVRGAAWHLRELIRETSGPR
ncbi:hypothetical protein PVAP13_5NG558900 [Panicum virgatum]|uniref:Uncharacterized protein n=1 Tax=Panicum virgatum TaxID=38727 RepID=A0A8T0S4G9_PANVG|nr:hypothetical protein PVAP13_5NG558900 [Panicum virgatum]